jgi:hypothetical protein
MKNRFSFAIPALALALAVPLAASPAPSTKQEPPAEGVPAPSAPSVPAERQDLRSRIHGIRYEVRYLDLHTAQEVAWEACGGNESCRVAAQSNDGSPGGLMEVQTDAGTHQKIVRRLAELDIAPQTQGFQLILLAGSAQAGASPKDLSAGAQKALNDLKGFLPYKSYALLDSSFLPATPEAQSTARLVGRGGAAYNLRMAFRSSGLEEKRQLFVNRFALREEGGTTPIVPSRTDGTGGTERRAPRDLVDTTFSLKPGETIVVGTSRLDGSEDALVVLLTALK